MKQLDPNSNDFLVQTLSAIFGGIVLFLLGLIYSFIKKRVKQYTNGIAKNWQILVGGFWIIYISYYIFNVTRSIELALLPVTFLSAIFLLIMQLFELKPSTKLNSWSKEIEKSKKILADLEQDRQKRDLEKLIDEKIQKQMTKMDSNFQRLKLDIIYQEIISWELQGVNENVINTCANFLETGKSESAHLISVLEKAETAIKRHQENHEKVSTYTATQLLKALQGIPEMYNPSCKRIKILLDKTE